ncbi:MAG: tetraacyldisaccharide 4'-kinase [Flavobacteriaceae bacterium]|nr:tetraacyldisaccharide 4'-kinase [Flavobacteriaceae bacterium]
MNKLRKILYPFALLYGEIVNIRNKAFDKGIFATAKFSIPTIVVGNLNVGGTGKSPQIEYLVRLLQKNYKIAVLSRGYKRKSKGFQLAVKNTTAKQIGDEPMQFHQKFNNIIVAVDTDRVNGINQLKKLKTPPNVILLDDAFQHRKVEAGFNILLTTYHNLYTDDIMLPAGNLREKSNGANRAQIIIVSKCPENLSETEQFKIAQKLKPKLDQTVFFSKIAYHNSVLNDESKIALAELKNYNVLLVTGIANANPLIKFLEKKEIQLKHLKYADHYSFSKSDKENIIFEFDKIHANKKIILTTEKDYVRGFSNINMPIYYLPIRTEFIENGDDFNKLILNYVQQNTRNS